MLVCNKEVFGRKCILKNKHLLPVHLACVECDGLLGHVMSLWLWHKGPGAF